MCKTIFFLPSIDLNPFVCVKQYLLPSIDLNPPFQFQTTQIMLALSINLWSSPECSSCIIFDSPSDAVVDTVLTVLEHHRGVGQGGPKLLQVSRYGPLEIFMFSSSDGHTDS